MTLIALIASPKVATRAFWLRVVALANWTLELIVICALVWIIVETFL